jgi:hypothetical protein
MATMHQTRSWQHLYRHLVAADNVLGIRRLQLVAPEGKSPVLGPTPTVAAPMYTNTHWNNIDGISYELDALFRGPNGVKHSDCPDSDATATSSVQDSRRAET